MVSRCSRAAGGLSSPDTATCRISLCQDPLANVLHLGRAAGPAGAESLSGGIPQGHNADRELVGSQEGMGTLLGPIAGLGSGRGTRVFPYSSS